MHYTYNNQYTWIRQSTVFTGNKIGWVKKRTIFKRLQFVYMITQKGNHTSYFSTLFSLDSLVPVHKFTSGAAFYSKRTNSVLNMLTRVTRYNIPDCAGHSLSVYHPFVAKAQRLEGLVTSTSNFSIFKFVASPETNVTRTTVNCFLSYGGLNLAAFLIPYK